MLLRRFVAVRFVFVLIVLGAIGSLSAQGNLDTKWIRFYLASASQVKDDILSTTLDILYPNDYDKQTRTIHETYLSDRASSASIHWAEQQISKKGLQDKDKVIPALVLLMDPTTSSSLTTPSLEISDIFPHHHLSGNVSYSKLAETIIVRNREAFTKFKPQAVQAYPIHDYPSTYSQIIQTFKLPDHQIEEVRESLKANLFDNRFTVEERKTFLLRVVSYFNTVHDKEFFDDLLTRYKKLLSDPSKLEERSLVFYHLYIISTFNGDDYFKPFFELIKTQYTSLPPEDNIEIRAIHILETALMMTFLQVHSEKSEVLRFLSDRLVYKEPGRFYRFLDSIAFTLKKNLSVKKRGAIDVESSLKHAAEKYQRILSVIN